jgi:4-hydroxy-2-oxoheptanedioate aldolase
VITSRVLKKLRAGEFVRVIGVNRVVEPWFTEVVGKTGFDLVWLDLEHRTYGEDVISPISLACRATGIDLMVRIRKTDYSSPMRALECGAQGIMVPHCRSAEEARQWVEWTRYPPLGRRGFDNAGADCQFALSDALQYLRSSNEEAFLALQIEDREALDHVEEMAAVKGVDLLFVGPADLSISLEVPLKFDHPSMRAAIDRVANATVKAGIWWGTTTSSAAAAQQALDRGARMVTCANDHFLLVDGLRNAYHEFAGISIGS